MKRETREWLILSVLILAFLLCGVIAFSQDSIKVKIIKVKKDFTIMKTIEKPRVKFKTECKSPYRVKEIIWIRRPSIY